MAAAARPEPIFTPSAMTPPGTVALASLTVTVSAAVYVDARCPQCLRKVMGVPGPAVVHVVMITTERLASGRGRVVRCKRCASFCEVVEHKPREDRP